MTTAAYEALIIRDEEARAVRTRRNRDSGVAFNRRIEATAEYHRVVGASYVAEFNAELRAGGTLMTPLSALQPYFAAFCVAHGADSLEAMKARDGQQMGCNFMIWNGQQWRAWAASEGRKLPDVKSQTDHASYAAWLAVRFPIPSVQLAA